MEERCDYATPCPCRCGWVLCPVFGDWRDEDDCNDCDERKEDNEGQEEQ